MLVLVHGFAKLILHARDSQPFVPFICHLHQNHLYRVIHKSLRNFRTQLRNNQDRHGRKEHINRERISLKVFFCTRGLGVLAGSTARG